jgi:phage baseplate assembly protein W
MDFLGRDLKVVFHANGQADLSWKGGDLALVEGRNNLEQALMLRLLIHRGELEELGHPRYGSLVRDLLGEPLDRENLELLRRYVRQALKQDPRVDEVPSIAVRVHEDMPGVVELEVTVVAASGEELSLEMAVDLG